MATIIKNQDGTFSKQLDTNEIKEELSILRQKLNTLNVDIKTISDSKDSIVKKLTELRDEKAVIKDKILSITSLDTTLIDPIDQM